MNFIVGFKVVVEALCVSLCLEEIGEIIHFKISLHIALLININTDNIAVT